MTVTVTAKQDVPFRPLPKGWLEQVMMLVNEYVAARATALTIETGRVPPTPMAQDPFSRASQLHRELLDQLNLAVGASRNNYELIHETARRLADARLALEEVEQAVSHLTRPAQSIPDSPV